MDMAEPANCEEMIFLQTELTNDDFLMDSQDHSGTKKVQVIKVTAQTSTTDAGIQGELD